MDFVQRTIHGMCMNLIDNHEMKVIGFASDLCRKQDQWLSSHSPQHLWDSTDVAQEFPSLGVGNGK